MLELLSDPQTYLSLFTLTALEIVLGVDNILFVSIVANRVHKSRRELARRVGLFLALFGRLGLLFSLSFVLGLTEPFFTLVGKSFSGRDVVLFIGGLFLIIKSTQEIFLSLESKEEQERKQRAEPTLLSAIVQIIILDIVFSLDSIITAVGLANHVAVMATAVVIAVIIMLLFARVLGEFLERHPSMKILGLAFLFTVAVLLVADAFGHHIPRGYVYFALAFSLLVEIINIRHRDVQR